MKMAPLSIAGMSEDNWSGQETDDPIYAGKRNFYMVEKLTKDGKQVDGLLFASNNFDVPAALVSGDGDRRPDGRTKSSLLRKHLRILPHR
jgi:hypothetical protein